jgi:hypothetical protein
VAGGTAATGAVRAVTAGLAIGAGAARGALARGGGVAGFGTGPAGLPGGERGAGSGAAFVPVGLVAVVGTARAGDGVGDATAEGWSVGCAGGGALAESPSAISGGSLSRLLGAAMALDT